VLAIGAVVLGAAVLLFLGAMIALDNHLVVQSPPLNGAEYAAVRLLSLIPGVLLGAFGGIVAFAITASRERTWIATGTGIVARGALLLAGLLVGAATLRAVHHPGTDNAKRYLDTLPTVAVIPPLVPATAKMNLVDSTSIEESAHQQEQFEDETRFRDITARRTCVKGSCSVTLTANHSPPRPEA